MREIIKKFPEEIVLKSQKIKAIVVKVEGVLTSSTVQFTGSSYLYTLNLLDNNIVKPLRENDIIMVAITQNVLIDFKHQANELSYDLYQSISHGKANLFNEITADFEVLPEEICFIGNDFMDLPFFKQVGLSICPNDSVEYIRSEVDFVTTAKGGEGVLREIADLILVSQNKINKVITF